MMQRMPDLSNAKASFERGALPGAFLGMAIGLIPGMLLVLVLGGGSYGVGLSEVLSFVVMSMVAGSVLGALAGGAAVIVVEAVQRALRSLQTKI